MPVQEQRREAPPAWMCSACTSSAPTRPRGLSRRLSALVSSDPNAMRRYEEAWEEHTLAWAQRTSTVKHYLNIDDILLACELDP